MWGFRLKASLPRLLQAKKTGSPSRMSHRSAKARFGRPTKNLIASSCWISWSEWVRTICVITLRGSIHFCLMTFIRYTAPTWLHLRRCYRSQAKWRVYHFIAKHFERATSISSEAQRIQTEVCIPLVSLYGQLTADLIRGDLSKQEAILPSIWHWL